MKFVATRTTAALTGVWTALGMGSLVVWEKHNPLNATTQNIVFLSMAIVFFFIPVFLFVFGPQKYYGIKDMASREYWENFVQVGIRGLCWFLGAAVFTVVYCPLLEWLYAN
jgi:hypothetical protein